MTSIQNKFLSVEADLGCLLEADQDEKRQMPNQVLAQVSGIGRQIFQGIQAPRRPSNVPVEDSKHRSGNEADFFDAA
jgi:hypothetical protein